MESIKRITDLLNSIPITPNNKKEIEGAKQAIADGDFHTALSIIQNLNKKKERQQEEYDEEEREDNSHIITILLLVLIFLVSCFIFWAYRQVGDFPWNIK